MLSFYSGISLATYITFVALLRLNLFASETLLLALLSIITKKIHTHPLRHMLYSGCITKAAIANSFFFHPVSLQLTPETFTLLILLWKQPASPLAPPCSFFFSSFFFFYFQIIPWRQDLFSQGAWTSFFNRRTQQKNQGTLWSTCLLNDEDWSSEQPPSCPKPLLKSTNHSIVAAQSALLSCHCERRGNRNEWHTGWSHNLANHVGTLYQDSIITQLGQN